MGTAARAGIAVLTWLLRCRFAASQAGPGQTVDQACWHEASMGSTALEISDGQTTFQQIRANESQRWFYRNFNVTTMNQPDENRKLIINLEPCTGTVYLFVRKTRRCYPNPYSCITKTGTLPSFDCTWTHFMSTIDGSMDGAPTLFEVPLSTTQWYIVVYAKTNAAYSLTVLADIGAFPRPGNNGRIVAWQTQELQAQLSWQTSSFIPAGISTDKQYLVYSSLLLDSDTRPNPNVFLTPNKILNTVCGLANNTDRPYSTVAAASCSGGTCNATINGVVTNKRYSFNVVAQSYRGFQMAYSGIIFRPGPPAVAGGLGGLGSDGSDKTLKVVGAVSGSVLGMVVIIYFLMLKLYG